MEYMSTILTILIIFSLFSVTPFFVYAKEFLDVPFTSQAPTGNWKDERFQNGCEEASVLMAMRWVQGKKIISKKQAKKEILALADYQKKIYGSSVDTSAQDTIDRLFKGYYSYTGVEVRYDITKNDIRTELQSGNIIITPMNGKNLKNPHFKRPGPTTHMLLILGYDTKKKEFITNDPGTQYGKNYHYKESTLESALRDYPTGDHLPITTTKKAMIIIYPQKNL